MFTNPGSKMKTTANVLFWLSLVGTVILAYVFSDEFDDFLIFAAIAICGAVISFISSLVLYGIGEAIEDIASTREIAGRYYELEKKKAEQEKTPYVKTSQVKASSPTVQTAAGPFNINDYI